MATRKPLVIISGLVQQLPAGDTIDAPVSSTDVISLTNGSSSAVSIGTPVYISAASTFQPSTANSSSAAKVIGLVKDTSIAASAGGVVQIDGVLSATTTQWNTITGGSGGLSVGSSYFLSPTTAGRLTTTAPSTGGEYVLPIGTAISTTELEISIGMRILL